MTDKEYIENIDKVDTDALFENLEYYGFDSYYRDLWYATIEELKKRIEIRPQGEWIIVKDEKWGDNVKCPFCGKELAGTDLNYCCKCGAELTGSEKINGGAE